MKHKDKKIVAELLAPAGSLEKLKYALHYGADAVYAGIPDFSMRRRINSFDEKILKEAIDFVHARKKKIYITVNIYAHNIHIKNVIKHLKFLAKAKPDAIILSDPGILELTKKHAPKIEIHLSTQANTTNWRAVKFWKKQGVKRIILAREVSLEEIKEIKKNVPGIELEYFVHGAMCMSYSGRCILSKWMAGRSANLGDCVQPCRWKYSLKSSCLKSEPETLFVSIEDEKREFDVDLEEDHNGTYFFNSKDLNLLEHLDELSAVGISSFKIEGRNKSVYYLAQVTRAYCSVLNALKQGVSKEVLKKIIKTEKRELDNLVHRGYTKGFLFGYEPEHNFKNSHLNSHFQFVGEIKGIKNGLLEILVHNAIYLKDKLSVISVAGNKEIEIKKILNNKMQEVLSAHGGSGKLFYLKIKDGKSFSTFDLIRKES